METRQARYKKTEKGKQKQAESQQRYLKSRVSWQTYLTPELSEQLKSLKPEGMSNAKFLESVVIPFFLNNSRSTSLQVSIN